MKKTRPLRPEDIFRQLSEEQRQKDAWMARLERALVELSCQLGVVHRHGIPEPAHCLECFASPGSWSCAECWRAWALKQAGEAVDSERRSTRGDAGSRSRSRRNASCPVT